MYGNPPNPQPPTTPTPRRLEWFPKERTSNKYAYLSFFSKGYEYYNPQIKPKIFLRNCLEELKPRKK